MLAQITPVILTFDEAPNIGRCLERLTWARDIVVVDSGSRDGTLEICQKFSQVRVFSRPFDSHAAQWNYAIGETGIESAWILALDADYMVEPGGVAELENLQPSAEIAGFWLNFRYAMLGRPLRSGIYPPVLALYRRDRGRYTQDGHTQRAVVDGELRHLAVPALHDDRKPLDRWVRSQLAYARLEAEKLSSGGRGLRGWLRTRTPFSPLAIGLYCLFWRGAAFEGPAGWLYALQRMIAEALITASLIDRRLRGV